MKKKTRLTEKKRLKIVALRARGIPFSVIAKKFGITETWARQVAFIEGKTIVALPTETRPISY